VVDRVEELLGRYPRRRIRTQFTPVPALPEMVVAHPVVVLEMADHGLEATSSETLRTSPAQLRFMTMRRGGFTPEEAGKIAGGNYLRIFRAAVG
jgi:hypothetical protein